MLTVEGFTCVGDLVERLALLHRAVGIASRRWSCGRDGGVAARRQSRRLRRACPRSLEPAGAEGAAAGSAAGGVGVGARRR